VPGSAIDATPVPQGGDPADQRPAEQDVERSDCAQGAIARADVRVSKKDIAERIGISRQHLHEIMTCRRPLSPEVAVRVAVLLGGSAASWLRMQAAYDAWHASRSVDVSRIKRLENA
jgi:addiction module HigA family antidote